MLVSKLRALVYYQQESEPTIQWCLQRIWLEQAVTCCRGLPQRVSCSWRVELKMMSVVQGVKCHFTRSVGGVLGGVGQHRCIDAELVALQCGVWYTVEYGTPWALPYVWA